MGGNEIVVERHREGAYVLFFTYRGVLDNYSGFLFVPQGGDPRGFRDLGETGTTIEPLEQQWYFVAHR